jgi:hypothetical protein
MTLVDGEVLVDEFVLTRADKEEVGRRAADAAADLVKRAGI